MAEMLDDLTSFPGIDRGSVFLVAGGTGAIGQRCAEVLVGVGARVAVMGRSKDRVDEVVEPLGHHGSALGVVGDVSRAADTTAAVGDVVDRWGRLDVLVNCAAVADSGNDLFHVTEDEIDTVFAVNLRGAILIARAAAAQMAAQGAGRIVHVSSIAAHRVQPGQVVYAASKAGLGHVTRQLAVELGPAGVTVNCVSPGQTPTHLRRFDEPAGSPPVPSGGSVGSRAETVPLRRRGVLDDYVGPILFLSSSLAGYVTGVDLPVEGGVRLTRPR